MLETLAIILIVLWILGLVSSYTMGGFIHILLVLALVVVALRVIQGRRVFRQINRHPTQRILMIPSEFNAWKPSQISLGSTFITFG